MGTGSANVALRSAHALAIRRVVDAAAAGQEGRGPYSLPGGGSAHRHPREQEDHSPNQADRHKSRLAARVKKIA